MKSILWKPDPWKGDGCRAKDSKVYLEENEKKTCEKKNIVYKNTCMLCREDGRRYLFIGETNRSLVEMATEH